MFDRLYDFNSIIVEAAKKNVLFTKIFQVEGLSWKIIDCLIEDEVMTLTLQ